jgi:hypothetical protein
MATPLGGPDWDGRPFHPGEGDHGQAQQGGGEETDSDEQSE